MLSNGYNDKYIVPNPQIPFEELRISKFSDRLSYIMYAFNVKVLHKASFMRKFSRTSALRSLSDASKNKKKHVESLKKYDEKNTFPGMNEFVLFCFY